MKKRVLFLCTGNASRSQMAEGFLKDRYPDRYEVESAGVAPETVSRRAAEVMAEIGIDLSGHRSKHVEEFRGQTFDIVATVCDNAKETCPFFPGADEYIHEGFPDPDKLRGPDEEVLEGFRRVRDMIGEWIDATFRE